MFSSPRQTTRAVCIVFTLVLIATACSSATEDDGPAASDAADTGEEQAARDSSADAAEEPAEDGGAESEEPSDTPVELAATWRGVSAETIAVGVVLIDFDFLVSSGLSPAGWGDQQAVWDAIFADINDRGGINGRVIEPIYENFNVIDTVAAEGTCVALVEDNDVFAVLGGFVGPVATANQCIVTANETILIGGELTDAEIEAARAPYYGSTSEATGPLLLDVLQAEGLADGAEVFVMNGGASLDSGPDAISELEDRGITVVGSGNIEAGPGDVVAQDAEVQLLTERVRTSGANTVLIRGNTTAAIRGLAAVGLTDELALWVTDSSELEELGDTVSDRSVADGALALAAATAAETFELERFQACVTAVEAAVPAADIRLLDDYAEDDENWYWPTLQACDAIMTFADIATAAGPELTHESFVSGADSLTEFDLPSVPFSSLGPGKINANDTIRLAEYDHTSGGGGLVPVTDLLDTTAVAG